jgi:hypothetical protein
MMSLYGIAVLMSGNLCKAQSANSCRDLAFYTVKLKYSLTLMFSPTINSSLYFDIL